MLRLAALMQPLVVQRCVYTITVWLSGDQFASLPLHYDVIDDSNKSFIWIYISVAQVCSTQVSKRATLENIVFASCIPRLSNYQITIKIIFFDINFFKEIIFAHFGFEINKNTYFCLKLIFSKSFLSLLLI